MRLTKKVPDIKGAKRQLRKKIREVNRGLSREYKARASERICRKVMEIPSYRNAKTVFCFVGTDPEPDTRALIEEALSSGKRVCVPLCLDDCTMVAKEIRGYEDLQQGMYGILEPREGLPEVSAGEIDFGVIPCVTCDHTGNRLGHGKGYYDRYLEGSGFPQVMLCYELVTVPEGEIPVGRHDLPVKTVITDA